MIVDDIEDMAGPVAMTMGRIKQAANDPALQSSQHVQPQQNQQQTVRIRKIRGSRKQDHDKIKDTTCCGSNAGGCGCDGDGNSDNHPLALLSSMFDEDRCGMEGNSAGAGNHGNRDCKVATHQLESLCGAEDPCISEHEPVGISSNDLNPASHTVYLKTWGCSHNNSDSEYMAGLLDAHGFRTTTTDFPSSSIVILNSCTVKGPSEQHFKNEIARAVSHGKQVVLAGCVSQSDRSYRKIASVIGVQQIDRIVEVVEETLLGNKLSYVSARRNGVRAPGPELNLPKIRKNELIEIIPISTGCLNNCTYCKTKLARGQLVSYSTESIVSRITHVCAHEGVKEIWLTSEDLGAWGIDLGNTIVDLLNAIVQVLPRDVMLRIGMTNPPYILDHLEEISRILSHPNVYEFLHIPVQSGSDSVLLEMKREYGSTEFRRICDFILNRLPSITLATDIICGYPTETDEDFEHTISLVQDYRFPVLFINQFYPRPGTPAARLKRIPTDVVKSRTRRLNALFQSYNPLNEAMLVGTVQRVLVTELAHDGVKFVGHNKAYQQVLVDLKLVQDGTGRKVDSVLGQWVDVEVVRCHKFSMEGGKGVVVAATETTNHSARRILLEQQQVNGSRNSSSPSKKSRVEAAVCQVYGSSFSKYFGGGSVLLLAAAGVAMVVGILCLAIPTVRNSSFGDTISN